MSRSVKNILMGCTLFAFAGGQYIYSMVGFRNASKEELEARAYEQEVHRRYQEQKSKNESMES